MKKLSIIIGLLILFFSGINSNAQITYNKNQPKSSEFTSAFNSDKVVVLNKPNFIDNNLNIQKNGFYQIGYILDAGFNTNNSGEWNAVEGGKIWLLEIKTEGAEGLIAYFDKLDLPQGSKLYIYNDDKSSVIGPIEKSNNSKTAYSSGIISGEKVIIEYYQPEWVQIKPIIDLKDIGYVYKGITKTWDDESGLCEININCPEGDDWQDEKRGIVKIVSREGEYIGLCTGSLVNNEREDGTPYILTACHCGETSTEEEFNQWQFYFNYESETCDNFVTVTGKVNPDS